MKSIRLDFLDSLRGFAAIFVVLYHFDAAYNISTGPLFNWINYTPLHFLYYAPAAVSLFFVFSGYVLVLSLNKSAGIDVIVFYRKRFFRIWPAYLAAFALSYILYSNYTLQQTSLADTEWIQSFWRTPATVQHLFKQLLILDSNKDILIPQSWTLRVIVQFSCLMPFLYLVCKKTNNITFLLFNLVLYFVFSGSYFIFHFSLGVFLGVNQPQVLAYFAILKNRYKGLIILLTVALFTYSYALPLYYQYFFGSRVPLFNLLSAVRILTGLGSFLILLYCLSSQWLQKKLSYRPFVAFGKLSYSIYLTHFMVLLYGVPLIVKSLNSAGVYNRHLIIPIALAGLLLITVIVSYLIRILVEVQFVKLENRLFNKNRKNQSTPIELEQQPEPVVLT